MQADLLLDGEHELQDVGVRLKGRLGSYRSLSQKAGFKVDTDTFVDGQTLLGLEIVDEGDTTVDMQALARQLWHERARDMGIATDG